MKLQKRYSDNRAFTLVEILVTLGIFIFIISFALGVGLDTYARTSINQERDQLVFLLSKTRARSLNNINQSEYELEVDDSAKEITIREVVSGDEEVTEYNDNYSITSGTVRLAQLTGVPVGGSFTFTLNGTGGPLTVDINNEGGITW